MIKRRFHQIIDWFRHITGKPTVRRKYPTYKSKRKSTKPKRGRMTRARYARVWLFYQIKRVFGVVVTVGILILIVIWFTLPSIDELNQFKKKASIVITSETGEIITSYGDVYGKYTPFTELPKSLIDAVMATEDRNFYYHPGIDPLGLARAIYANLKAGHVVQGGSTITQQVAKNVFLTPERSLSRKFREMLLAFKLEWHFTKEEIITIYLNRVYLGAGNYGIDAASHRYFGKPASEMTLSESAMIAGLLKAPSRFAPTNNPELSQKRAEQVIVNMADAGYISAEHAKKARAEIPSALEKRNNITSSNLYFGDYVLEQIPKYVTNLTEDIIVTTTLRPEWQMMGEEAIKEVMDSKDAKSLKASQAALVAIAPSGAIRVMIGGRDYGKSQYNRAYQAMRQPGSSFKLFVYLAGLESGLIPDSTVVDEPVHIGKWSPGNYSGKYEGAMTLRQAVSKSINSVAVQVSERAGRGNVINMAKRLGLTSDLEPLPSIALGSVEASLLEMTGAYAHLAADGRAVTPFAITKIQTKKNKVIYEHPDKRQPIVIRADIVGMMNDLLTSVVSYGTGTRANIGRSAAGKTGTTSDYRDAWFIGYTPDLAAGVWVGNDNNTPMKKVTGGTLPAPIWQHFMKKALANTPASSLPIRTPAPLPWQTTINEMPSSENQDQPENGVILPFPTVGHETEELGDDFWQEIEDSAPIN